MFLHVCSNWECSYVFEVHTDWITLYFAKVPTNEKYKSITCLAYFNVIDNFTLLSSLVNITGVDVTCLIAIFC